MNTDGRECTERESVASLEEVVASVALLDANFLEAAPEAIVQRPSGLEMRKS